MKGPGNTLCNDPDKKFGVKIRTKWPKVGSRPDKLVCQPKILELLSPMFATHFSITQEIAGED